MKQSCLLSLTLFGIFSSLLLSYAFDSSQSVPPYSPDGKLFNVAHLRTKTKVKTALVRDLLFADDTAFATHFEAALQRFITKLGSACINFGLKISLEKTNVSAQDVSHAPEIKISDHTLVVVDEFTYLGSTISMNSGLDSESPEESANTPAGMSKLTNRAWENIYLKVSKSTSTRHAFAVPCSTAVKLGPPT